MSFLPCDLCGFMINTDDDPECFQEWSDGSDLIVCPKCRGEEDDSDLRQVPFTL